MLKQRPESVELQIDGITSQGQGVGRLEGLAVFVPGALPGERVRARIIEAKKRFARAALEAVVEPSAYRREASCPLYPVCGGCSLQHVDYKYELELKRLIVQQDLQRIGGVELEVPLPVAAAEPWAYRNRAVLHYDGNKLGFYNESSHTVVPVERCALLHPALNGLLHSINDVFSARDLLPQLRGLALRCNGAGDRLLLSFICHSSLSGLEETASRLMQEEPKLISVWENYGPPSYSVYGEKWRRLAGDSHLRDSIGPVLLDLSPGSFLQVNHTQTIALYELVRGFAALDGTQTVLDLYSGVGSIALYLAPYAKQVVGVESYAPAVADAQRNAALNQAENCVFRCGRAEELLPAWSAQGRHFDVIVLDPPRAGCDKKLLHAVAGMAPSRLIYVSCDPATLARDLRELNALGYKIDRLQPVDMFSKSFHVETVCCLYHQKKESIFVSYETKDTENIKQYQSKQQRLTEVKENGKFR